MTTLINDIKILRKKTNAGFSDCKKAIEKANGDIEKAEKILKEMGLANAAKRGDRITGEGSIFVKTSSTHAAILELACETDFVARNNNFQVLGNAIIDDFLIAQSDKITEEIKIKITDLIGTIKENMEIKRVKIFEKKENEICAVYAHGKPARLGAIVMLSSTAPSLLSNEKVAKFAHNCALHAVARTPLFLDPQAITDTYKNTQIDIFTTQVNKMEKPENITQGIIQGKWKKHLKEICFMLQPWVHDEKTTPATEIHSLSEELGVKFSITSFAVFVLGEE